MSTLSRIWRRYLAYAWLFSLGVNLLQLTFPIYMLQIYDRVLTSRSEPTLLALTALALAALAALGLLDLFRSRLLVCAGCAVDAGLSPDLVRRMLRAAAAPTPPTRGAGIADVASLRNFLSTSSVFALFDAPWTPLYLLLIFLLHPWLGLIAAAGGLVVLALGVVGDRAARPLLERSEESAREAGRTAMAGLRNAQAVCALGMTEAVTNRWEKSHVASLGLLARASFRSGALQAVAKPFRVAMQVFIYGAGAWLALRNEVSPGAMIAASIIMGRALQPLEIVAGAYRQFGEARAAKTRLDEAFTGEPAGPKLDLPPPAGRVSLENVSFAAAGRVVLQNVTFSLAPGEFLGLIGPSAAGKSTLCRLVTGLWPAASGEIRLDGARIDAYDPDKLGRHVGFLPQDVELFPGTVAENIARLGELDSDKVVAAARAAGAHEMILRLPSGYDTPVGEAGAGLSGGQRQRVALARALYGDPALVVLDEPAASLDAEGEAALAQALAGLKARGATVLLVSHKPSTVAGADTLLVLKEGRPVLFGEREKVLAVMQGRETGRG